MSESMELLSELFSKLLFSFFLVQEKIVSPPEQKDFVFLVRKDSFEHSQLFPSFMFQLYSSFSGNTTAFSASQFIFKQSFGIHTLRNLPS